MLTDEEVDTGDRFLGLQDSSKLILKILRTQPLRCLVPEIWLVCVYGICFAKVEITP